MGKQPDIAIVQGKAISKTDKELVSAVLGGEMKNAWQLGNGVDTRGVEGPYAKRGAWSSATDQRRFRAGYDNIRWED